MHEGPGCKLDGLTHWGQQTAGPTCKQERAARKVEMSSDNARKVNHLPCQKTQASFFTFAATKSRCYDEGFSLCYPNLQKTQPERIQKKQKTLKIKKTTATQFN